MANLQESRRYVFDRDFTAVQFQEFVTPPTDTSNKTYLRGSVVDAVIRTGVANDLRIVTADGYDITEAVSLAPQLVVLPIVQPTPPVTQPAPRNGMANEPIFSRNEKRVIGFVLLILVIIIIAKEAK